LNSLITLIGGDFSVVGNGQSASLLPTIATALETPRERLLKRASPCLCWIQLKIARLKTALQLRKNLLGFIFRLAMNQSVVPIPAPLCLQIILRHSGIKHIMKE
jgi:hypothetical protein